MTEIERDERIDSILERHQGAMTKAQYKAAGDEIRDLIRAAIAAVQADRPVAEALYIIAPWKRRDHLSLHCGEITAQEFRTVVAVLKSIESQIRAAAPSLPAAGWLTPFSLSMTKCVITAAYNDVEEARAAYDIIQAGLHPRAALCEDTDNG